MISRLIDLIEHLRSPECKIIRKSEAAVMPGRGSDGAAGYDLASAEELEIPARGRALVHTGLLVAPPKGCHIEVRPRSGLALKHGITVLNSPGTIDEDYRGEIMVILFNTSDEPFHVMPGDRIAQAVVMRHENARWREVSAFDRTDRGAHGFGSTGK